MIHWCRYLHFVLYHPPYLCYQNGYQSEASNVPLKQVRQKLAYLHSRSLGVKLSHKATPVDKGVQEMWSLTKQAVPS